MSEFIDYVFQRSTSLNKIDNSLYSKYNEKNGLRNEDGTGVLVGLTRISDVVGYKKENGKKIDTEGELYYRGVKVSDFIKGHDPKNRFLFEEVCFLILFGYLPNKDELDAFKKELNNEVARYLVAKLDGKVVGYVGIWFVMDEGHITNVAVHSDYRGRKIGDKLVQALVELCRENNIVSMTLEVRVSNIVAQNLYKKYGFKLAGIRKEYYSDNKEDAMIMWNDIKVV